MNSSVRPDLAPRTFEVRYDGDTLLFRINGFEIMSMPWNGVVNCDRVTIGGVKFGDDPSTLFAKVRFTELVGPPRASATPKPKK